MEATNPRTFVGGIVLAIGCMAMQAVFVACYKLCRKTPAMASMLADNLWTIEELIERAALS